LRAVSGNKALVLPYWDYYANPELPAELTNTSLFNPFYVARQKTDVIHALTLAPFGNTVINMQRSLPNAFEVLFEDVPHNAVHNIIGSVMATMESPTPFPLFS